MGFKRQNKRAFMKQKQEQMQKSKGVTETSPLPLLSGTIAPRNIKDAKRILSKLISAFIKGEFEDNKARTLCYLLTQYVTITRDSDFEKRLEILEERENDKS